MMFGKKFLTDPSHLPAPESSEPWGDQSLSIPAPGGSYLFTGLDSAQVELALAHFGPNCEANPPTDQRARLPTTRLYRISADRFLSPYTLTEPYQADIRHTPGLVETLGLRMIGRMHLSTPFEGALWTSEHRDPLWFCRVVLQNYLRLMVAYQTFLVGGVALHSAAIVSEGRTHLFLGHSGDGKSTLSGLSLAEGKRVLSDDLNALMPSPEGFTVESVPLSGAYGGQYQPNNRAPLAQVYRLVKDRGHRVEPVSPAAIFAKCLANAPYLNSDRLRLPELIERLHRLLSQVPSGSLHFSRDPGVWEAIRQYQGNTP